MGKAIKEKALEIIIKYEIDMPVFKKSDYTAEYNFKTKSKYVISDEQFDLIKGVIKEYE